MKSEHLPLLFYYTHTFSSSFTLLYCRGRQRNVQRVITHVQNHCSAYETFCLATFRCRCRRGYLKLPICCFKTVTCYLSSSFTLLYCRGRQRNVQRVITQVQNHCSAYETFCLATFRCRCRRGYLKLPICCFKTVTCYLSSSFTLLYCRGRQRNVQRVITQVQNHCSAYETFCLATFRCRCRRGYLKLPICCFKTVTF